MIVREGIVVVKEKYFVKMSFAKYKQVVEEGDLVILFLGYNYMLPLTVSAGETYQTKFGALRHNDIIGKKYGSKVRCLIS